MPTPEIDLHGHHWVNTIGHSAGILVFATLFLLLYRDSRRSGQKLRILPLVSTLLALGWDLGLLLGLATREQSAFWGNASAALAFACLSLLPAVLLDLGLSGNLAVLRVSGYTVAGICALLHLSEILIEGPDIHGFALMLLSGGFAVLAALAFFYLRRRAGGISPAAALSIFLLSISFLHFRGQADTHTLWTEILLHHAGIPIALFVVLQDYRFLLADAFLRLTANGVLAASFITVGWLLRQPITTLLSSGDPFWHGMLFVGAALALFGFAKARESLQAWLTRRVFLRRNPDEVAQALAALDGDENAILERAAKILAAYFRAAKWQLSALPLPDADATLTLQFLKGDQIHLSLRGRRFLSEDLEALKRFGAILAREIDRARTREMERLVVQAELKALQAQIHPHFLFNALNALYGSIPRAAADARRLALSLSEVFRYFLTTSKSTVRLEEELNIIEAYLEIEKARLGDRLSTFINIPASVRNFSIPVLSLQPLVENAIKHGIAAQPGPGVLTLNASLENSTLTLFVHDTGPGPGEHTNLASNRVGLDNVRRRLILHYGDQARLTLKAVPDGTLAELRIPVQPENPPAFASQSAAGANSLRN